jgi:radical SAM-linked protein
MLKFTKGEIVKFTSHLDMVRMFKRAFQRSGIRLTFSAGFNPHPKMTLAQPLSLGYTSVGEWIEFETAEDWNPEELKSKLAATLPVGIKLLEISTMKPEEKSLASRCNAAEYTIAMCLDHEKSESTDELVSKKARLAANPQGEDFLQQSSINVKKTSKKHKDAVEIDIKPLIHYMSTCVVDNNIFISTELAAGSTQNLSPELLIDAFLEFYQLNIPRETIEVLRTELIM